MKRTFIASLLIAISPALFAQYVLTKGTFSGIGGSTGSASYILNSAGGQSVTGEGVSETYIEQAGFYTYGTIRITGIEEACKDIPTVFSLGSPYPNPARGRVILRYGVPTTANIDIRVYDVAGRVVSTLVRKCEKPGYYTLNWSLRTENNTLLPSGIYFIVMRAGKFRSVKKIVLLR